MFSDTDVEELLGWNDGTRVGIKSHALSSLTVQSHEGIHARIFNETADGHLHRVCCLAAGTDLDQRHAGAYTHAAKIMFEDTRLAHEAAATYLSIQGLPTRPLRRAEYKKLTREYKEYYALLDELTKTTSPTTWLRFAFGWAFIHWCFQSRRFDQFFASKNPRLQLFLDVPSPTERFIRSKEYLLADGRAQEWTRYSLSAASTAFSHKGFDLWDFHSEAAWNERSEDLHVGAFENQLTSDAGDWLCEHLPFENADFRRPQKTFGVGFDYAMRELRLIPAPLFCGPDSVLDQRFQDANIERLARAHAADVVDHRPSCDLVDLSEAPFAETMGGCLLAIAESTHVIVLDHADEEKLIFLCRRERVSVSPEGSFSYDAIGSFVLGRALVAALVQGRLAPKPDGTQIPELWVMLRTSRDRLFETWMTAYEICGDVEKPIDPVKGPQFLLPSDRLHFYFDGPWVDVYNMNVMSVTSRKVSLIDDPNSPSAKLLSVRMAASPAGLPGVLIAAKPPWAGHHLDRYEQQQFSNGGLTQLELDEAKASELMTPLMNAWHVWDRF